MLICLFQKHRSIASLVMLCKVGRRRYKPLRGTA